jgi:hypothetical protein
MLPSTIYHRHHLDFPSQVEVVVTTMTNEELEAATMTDVVTTMTDELKVATRLPLHSKSCRDADANGRAASS